MQLNRSAEDEITYAFASPFDPQQHQLQRHHCKPPRAPSLALTTSSHCSNSNSRWDYEVNDNGEEQQEDQFRHFRKKRVVTATNLQLDVNDLKAQVANLLLLRSILESRAIVRREDTAGSLVRTARAYYELFRDGYMTTARMTALTKRKRPLLSYEYHAASDSSSGVSKQQQALDQAAFLRSAMTPTMEAGPIENGGPPLKLEQWRRYSDYFALRDFKMTSCDVVFDDQVAIVRTKGEFTFRVTHETITGVFPHLLESEDQGDDSNGAPIKYRSHQWLLDKIMGLQLTCPCFIDMYFDATGRVNRYDEAGDFLRAFATVLKDPSDLATLFNGALLWEAGLIGALDSMGMEDTGRSFIAASPSSRRTRHTTPGSALPPGAEGSGVSATVSSGKQQATRVRKLYDIGFLLNHNEGVNSEAILDSQQQ